MSPRFSVPRPVIGILCGALLTLGGVACAEEAVTAYGPENSDNFFASCSDPTSDSILTTRICQCAVESVEAEYLFDEFVALDDELAAADRAMEVDPDVPVDPVPVPTPEALVEIVADCVILEAEL